jgi:formamidopyrimidine-DNA glycosylase
MPELPEVETTVRGLRAVLEGRRLTAVEPRRADLRRPFPPDLRQRMTGARVTALGRRAKYGLIDTDREDTMIFHLGMSGRWRIDPDELTAHDHLLIETEEGHRLALQDPRRFGSVDLVPTAELDSAPFLAALGPEPLSSEFDGSYLQGALAGRLAPIKALLLDQRIVAGLGNIYVCEALHMAGIAPWSRWRSHRGAPAPAPRRCHQGGAACGYRGRRVDPARLRPPGRRTRLFRASVASLRARRGGVRLRPPGAAAAGGRPLNLLLCALPALKLDLPRAFP